MIPIQIISKLARSRSHVALATKTFVTTGTLWKQKQGDRKSRDDSPEEGSKNQQQSRGPKDDEHRNAEEHDVKKQRKPTEELEYLEKKKQGEGSSCGPIQSPHSHHKARKSSPLESDGDVEEKDGSQDTKSRGCGCPPYATPKHAEEKESQKNTSSTAEKDVPKISKQDSKCEPQRSRAASYESNKGSREEDQYNAQKINEPREIDSSRKNTCPPGKGTSTGDDAPKRRNYCGPVESSYKDASREDKDMCSKYDKQRKDPCPKTSSNQETEFEDPCKKPSRNEEDCLDICKEKMDPCEPKTSRNNCLDRENEGDDRSDPCPTPPASCPDECDEAKAFRLDPCQTSRGSDCPEEECPDERNDCPKDPCKKEIVVPELATWCKVNAAKECICKLKELQKQWEEVIAAQEGGGKDDCPKPQEHARTDRPEPARVDKRSNMIYVVLSAILAAVVYYTYTGDFEPEELFWEDEEMTKGDIEEDE